MSNANTKPVPGLPAGYSADRLWQDGKVVLHIQHHNHLLRREIFDPDTWLDDLTDAPAATPATTSTPTAQKPPTTTPHNTKTASAKPCAIPTSSLRAPWPHLPSAAPSWKRWATSPPKYLPTCPPHEHPTPLLDCLRARMTSSLLAYRP